MSLIGFTRRVLTFLGVPAHAPMRVDSVEFHDAGADLVDAHIGVSVQLPPRVENVDIELVRAPASPPPAPQQPGDLDFLRVVDEIQRTQEKQDWAQELGAKRPWATFGYELGPDATDEEMEQRREYEPFVIDFYPDTPIDVLRARGQRLIDLGLMTGCMCGCRGDMEVTEQGLLLLEGRS